MKLLELYRNNRPEFFRVIRYLLAGGWNTVFGVGLYTAVYELWGTSGNYLFWAVLVNILAITNAFLCYKFFVFRTKGNFLREYLKCQCSALCHDFASPFLIMLLDDHFNKLASG